MIKQTVQMMVDYHYWSHRRVWDYILRLSDEQFTQALSYSVGSIHEQVVHSMGAEHVWLTRLQGHGEPMLQVADYPTRDAIRTRWDQLETDFKAYLASLSDADFERVVTFTTSRGETFQHTVAEIVLHVVNHGTDHRSQTLAMMYTLGAETTWHDLIGYLREPK